jgi:hypothetical protein
MLENIKLCDITTENNTISLENFILVLQEEIINPNILMEYILNNI